MDCYPIRRGVGTSLACALASYYRTYSYKAVASGFKIQPVKDEVSVSVCISTKT